MTSIPVTLLTGLPGSGKTTLLNQLLRPGRYPDSLVVIQAFGEAGLDHPLVAHARDESLTGVPVACACCVVGQDTRKVLVDAPWRFSRGGQRLFSRVFIETAGQSDPQRLAHTLATDKRLAELYCLQDIIAVVSAEQGVAALDAAGCVQIAPADTLVITKTDIAGPEATAALQARLHELKPQARRYVTTHGISEPPFALREGNQA